MSASVIFSWHLTLSTLTSLHAFMLEKSWWVWQWIGKRQRKPKSAQSVFLAFNSQSQAAWKSSYPDYWATRSSPIGFYCSFCRTAWKTFPYHTGTKQSSGPKSQSPWFSIGAGHITTCFYLWRCHPFLLVEIYSIFPWGLRSIKWR